MEVSRRLTSFNKEIEKNIAQVDLSDIKNIIELIISSKKVFTVGQGRSALIAQLFAIRLHQLGFRVFVAGEDLLGIVPPVKGEGNVVLAISGSGSTEDTLTYAQSAKEKGAKIIAITSYPKSELAKVADYTLIIKGRTQKWTYKDFLEREIRVEGEPVTSEGSLFEISTLVLLEGIASEIHHRIKK